MSRNNTVQTIQNTHRSCDDLQNPLIFWEGEERIWELKPGPHLSLDRYKFASGVHPALLYTLLHPPQHLGPATARGRPSPLNRQTTPRHANPRLDQRQLLPTSEGEIATGFQNAVILPKQFQWCLESHRQRKTVASLRSNHEIVVESTGLASLDLCISENVFLSMNPALAAQCGASPSYVKAVAEMPANRKVVASATAKDLARARANGLHGVFEDGGRNQRRAFESAHFTVNRLQNEGQGKKEEIARSDVERNTRGQDLTRKYRNEPAAVGV
ncbi:hypothetical protein PR048_028755 [Dryococelus australis]|uniref:Uncharacterized protein n=1 Tax=Dryococelus australis TaxID=614101 RepID=A0ABQ9GC32_9NEOP|nr:hypothetical protein PR048_028755 [Dryococelus australis]